MKRLLGLFSVLCLVACQPKDNSLNTQNPDFRNEGRVSSNNLRVGAYGLPIFAAQILEQLGALTSDCLQAEPEEIRSSQESSDLQIKKCIVRVHDQDRKGVSGAREKWQIQLVLNSADNQLVSAQGEILSSQDYGQFRSTLVELQYSYKEFFMKVNPTTGHLEVEIQAYGETKSENSTLKFDYNLKAQGQEITHSTTQWSFNNLKFDLKVRDPKSQVRNFHVSSKTLQLNWKSPRCAEITGEAETMDQAKQKDKRSIRLSPNKAELIATKGSPWSQNYDSCEVRKDPLRNFEFLFY